MIARLACRRLVVLSVAALIAMPAAAGPRAVRIIQTNAAGDNVHVIDPATDKVVGIIDNIEVPHGVTAAPDGTKIYITDEALSTLDIVDALTLKDVTPDGKYAVSGSASERV